jgi:transcriptional regulator with XRE-family HTH domain
MFTFTERLAFARKKKGLTQTQLADLLGVKSGKQTISNWELGKSEPALSDLIRLAELLEVTVGWLVDGGQPQPPSPVEEMQPGYISVPMQEYIELQRQLIKKQSEELNQKQSEG